jgi:hypothetical protein
MKESKQPEALSQLTETPVGEFASHPSSGRRSSVVNSSAESARLIPRQSNESLRSVDLHIGELVLNGFAPADRYTIGDAVERELTRLFHEQGTPPAISEPGETTHLDMNTFELMPGSSARTIGVELAKAIYGGLSQ